jgi:hypothetical protein
MQVIEDAFKHLEDNIDQLYSNVACILHSCNHFGSGHGVKSTIFWMVVYRIAQHDESLRNREQAANLLT